MHKFTLLFFIILKSNTASASSPTWKCERNNPRAYFEIFALSLEPTRVFNGTQEYHLVLKHGLYDLHQREDQMETVEIANRLECHFLTGQPSVLFCEKSVIKAREDGDRSNSYFTAELQTNLGLDETGKTRIEKKIKVQVVSPYTRDPKNSGANMDPDRGLLKFFEENECTQN